MKIKNWYTINGVFDQSHIMCSSGAGPETEGKMPRGHHSGQGSQFYHVHLGSFIDKRNGFVGALFTCTYSFQK